MISKHQKYLSKRVLTFLRAESLQLNRYILNFTYYLREKIEEYGGEANAGVQARYGKVTQKRKICYWCTDDCKV